MNARHYFAAACCLALGIALGQFSPSSGQQILVQPPGAIGRYQISVAGPNATVNVCDTSTGQCWIYNGNKQWLDIGSPAVKPAPK